jgi:hypothetical protein
VTVPAGSRAPISVADAGPKRRIWEPLPAIAAPRLAGGLTAPPLALLAGQGSACVERSDHLIRQDHQKPPGVEERPRR